MRCAPVLCWLWMVSLPGLGHATGAVTDPGARFPLHAEGTRLVDAAGRDFRVIGDAPWTLIVALTVAEADGYLAARQAAGFNALLVELIEPEFSGPRNRNGDLPFPEGRDFSEPSPAYFRHATAVLDLARSRGFLVLLAPAYVGWHCGTNGYCQQMLKTPDPVLEAYGRFVGQLAARYPNIIWVQGGDVDAGQYGAMAKVEAVYRGINQVIPGALHTAHCSRNFSAIDCYDRPWLGINTTYSECEHTPERVLLDRSRVTHMPSIYIEGRYEEEKASDLCLRSQIWWSFLGGQVGHVFGNKRIWRFESDWRDALDTHGARAMTVASRVLRQLGSLTALSLADSPLAVNRFATAWSRLRQPDSAAGLAWSGLVSGDREIPVAKSQDATVAYIPYLTRFEYPGAGDTLCWIDPQTGTVVGAPVAAAEYVSPGNHDWLFVAERTPRLCAEAQH